MLIAHSWAIYVHLTELYPLLPLQVDRWERGRASVLLKRWIQYKKRSTTKHKLESPPTNTSLFLQKTVGKQTKKSYRATSIIGCVSHPGATFSPNIPYLVGVPFQTTDHERNSIQSKPYLCWLFWLVLDSLILDSDFSKPSAIKCLIAEGFSFHLKVKHVFSILQW